MNIKSEITSNLNGKGFDDFTIIRWIYLYVCRTFSYDYRFYNKSNYELRKQIYEKELNLEKVEDFEIVCYTFAKVLKEALELCGFKNVEIKKGAGDGFSHAYVVIKHKGYKLKLDPTTRHDTTRVKMHSTTLDFVDLNEDPDFLDEVLQADKEINAHYEDVDLTEYYNNDSIVKLVKTIENVSKVLNLTPKRVFEDKVDYLFTLINCRDDFTRYDDIDYYFSYLIRKFKINENGLYFRPAIFFKKSDPSLKDVINIIHVKYKNEPVSLYVLQKIGNNFKVRKIFKDEALELLEEYESPNVQNFFEEEAKKLPEQGDGKNPFEDKIIKL